MLKWLFFALIPKIYDKSSQWKNSVSLLDDREVPQ